MRTPTASRDICGEVRPEFDQYMLPESNGTSMPTRSMDERINSKLDIASIRNLEPARQLSLKSILSRFLEEKCDADGAALAADLRETIKRYKDLGTEADRPGRGRPAFVVTTDNIKKDGAPAHRAAAVQEWCNDNFPDFISLQEWPANSPDLNPMDYTVWSVLEAKACRKPHRSVDLLKKTLLKAWEELDLTYLRAAVDDFPMRLKACIEANGDIFEP
ncbi:unnamed protein product [Nippostrongylus brasiliensis]|uniref:DDE_3 domain-containing protein n=1 Tax=Nippostrongylus brasiliensis TaxID=27835 RepID=A0A0N4Y0X0_NIPBR|nr:unnamed protein product [Nippostrongylus brasiliensis]